MNLFDFDPTSLVQPEDSSSKQSGNPIIYNTNPSRSNAEDGHYRSTIKVIFNPFSFKDSVVERQSYSITDEKNNPHSLEGIKILSIHEYTYQEGELVVVTASGIHYQDIERLLKEKNIFAYCPLNIQAISDS